MNVHYPRGLKFLQSGISRLALVSLLLNGALWLFVAVTYSRDNPAAILHLSSGAGLDVIGWGSSMLLIPLVGFFIIAINGVLAFCIRNVNMQILWLLLGIIPVIQLFLILAYSTLWLLNR